MPTVDEFLDARGTADSFLDRSPADAFLDVGRPLSDEDAEQYFLKQRLAAAPPGSYPTDPGTELVTAIGQDPGAFIKSIPEIALGAATAPGRLAFNTAADVVSSIDPEHGNEYGGNLAAMMSGGPLPVDKFLAEVSKTNPNLAVAGKTGKSLAEMAPLAGVAMAPATVQRLLAAGFTADMIAHAPELASELGTELGKPESEQDPDKITTLQSGLIQTAAFSPFTGRHAFKDVAITKGDKVRLATRELRGALAGEPSISAELIRTGSPETAKVLTQPERIKDALQEQTATEGVLRQERPEVELPRVAERGAEAGQADAAVAPKAEQALTELPSPEGTAKNVPGAVDVKAAAPEQSSLKPQEPGTPSPTPMESPMGAPGAAPDLISRLESLKFKEPGAQGQLFSLPHPDAIKAIGKQAWNDAIDLAIAAVKGGKLIGDGIDAAISYLKKNVQNFDEAKARQNFAYIIGQETKPVVDVPATAGSVEAMRKSAARATTSPEIPAPVQETIKTAPESFYKRQSGDLVEDAVKAMSNDQLLTVPAESNLFVASRLERANRFFQEGRMDEGYNVFVELEKQGTSFGQNINQFKRLVGTMPENITFLINKKLKEAGRDPLTKEQEAKTIEIARDSKSKDAALKDATDAWSKEPTDANAAKAEKALDAANASALELQSQVAKFQPRSTPAILKSVLQGNLLTPISLVANLFGNVAFLPFRSGARTIGAGLDIIDAAIRNKPREIGVHPVSGTTEAAKGAVRGLKTVPEILKRGTGEVIKGETRAGLHPIRAWINQFAKNPDAPTTGGKLTFNDRINLAIEGTLGAPAEVMLRGLGAGDAPFREAARARAITQQLLLDKVPRDQWAMAQKFPELFFDAAKLERIKEETLSSIFQRESGSLNNLNSIIRNNFLTKKLGVSPDFMDLAVATVAPYKLTPWNIIGEILSYNPLIAMARVGLDAKRGNSRQAKLNAGKLVVGSMLTTAGWWLYQKGLLAPSMDERDEAQKARMLAGEVLPPNHINISGLERALKGGDPAFKPGDKTVDVFRAGGLAGAMFYMTANIGRDFERRPEVGNDDIFTSILTQSGLEQARFGLNQSFLSGVEGLLTAVKDGNAESYVQSWANTVTALPLPNSLGALTRATREYKVDTKDDTLVKRINNVVNNRLGVIGLDEYLPLKRDLWGKPVPETPKDRNALIYQFFDITKGKQVTDDPVALELYRLWRKTANTEVIPSLPGKSITFNRQTYQLNPTQQSRLAELVGGARREVVDAMVVNPNFHTAPDETKIQILKRAYDHGKRVGDLLFIQENPNLTPKPARAGF